MTPIESRRGNLSTSGLQVRRSSWTPGLSTTARRLVAEEQGRISPLSVLRYSMDKRTNLEIVVRYDCQLTEPRIPSTSSPKSRPRPLPLVDFRAPISRVKMRM